MRIVFMGTPDFAVSSLEAVIGSSHEVVAVFTRADKPRARGNKVVFSPVKSASLAHGIPIEQPASLKNDEAVEVIRGYKPDCIAVAAYGLILPEVVLNLPEYGCLNVHASLLPRYRGAAPINRCIMDGERESGITIMQMDKGIDTGDMLLSGRVNIKEDMTASQLHDVLAKMGGELLVKALDGIASLTGVKQDDSMSCNAAMLTKDDCRLDFTKPAKEVYNQIRGLADAPCSYTFLGEKRIKVYKAVIESEALGIPVTCRDGGVVVLTEIQPEGGKRMSAADFLKGNKI